MNKLQAARQAAGLTQQQLAEKSGVSISAIQKFERGSKDINEAKMSTILSLCTALQCRLSGIISDKDMLHSLGCWAEDEKPE